VAKYKFGNISVLSGRIGGLVFKNGANGPYVQKYTKKKNVKSSLLRPRGNVPIDPALMKNLLTTLSSHWKTLSPMEQFSYDAGSYKYPPIVWAGTSRRRSPKSLFVSLNTQLMAFAGRDINTINRTCINPQVIHGVTYMRNPSLSIAGSQMKFLCTFSDGLRIVPNDHILVCSGTYAWTGLYPFTPSTQSHIFHTIPAGINMDTYNFYFDYVASFGDFTPQCTVYLGCFLVNLNTGQRSKTRYLKFEEF